MNESDTCPKCRSENVISHTDKELRERQKLIWQCSDCGHLWETDWKTDTE